MEEVIVIGGGLMGSATAWQLSKKGVKVLLIEQQNQKYTFGSSYGETRISRSLGPKEDIFSYLQQLSIAETKGLLSYLNEVEKSQSHQIENIYSTTPVTYIFNKSHQMKVDALCHSEQKDNYTFAAGKDADKIFGMALPEDQMVIREFKKYSGTFNPRILISYLQKGFQKKGNAILFNEKVVGIIQKEDLFSIELMNSQTFESKTFHSKSLVVAAGPYNGGLSEKIAPEITKLIAPKKIFLAFHTIENKAYGKLTEFEINRIRDFHPVFNQNDRMFFSIIDRYDPNSVPIFKTGGHQIRKKVKDLDLVWNIAPTAKEKSWSRNELYEYFKMIGIPIQKKDIKYVEGYSCVYSMTDNEIPVIKKISTNNPSAPVCVIIGGMSGIGAKGSLAYGLMASNLLLDIHIEDKMYYKTVKALQH